MAGESVLDRMAGARHEQRRQLSPERSFPPWEEVPAPVRAELARRERPIVEALREPTNEVMFAHATAIRGVVEGGMAIDTDTYFDAAAAGQRAMIAAILAGK